MSATFQTHLAREEDMSAFGAIFANHCREGVVYLEGGLGAGKTYLSRAIIQSLGHVGRVKSPTYTLVEPYELSDCRIYHFDLYRLEKVDDLLYLGVDDYFEPTNLCLIEWPQKGEGALPSYDIKIRINTRDEGRDLVLISGSVRGEKIINKLILDITG